MKIVNFELREPSFGIELVGMECTWDLHNVATFLGLSVDPESNSAVMKWAAGGHLAFKYAGCNLLFGGLKSMVIRPRDEGLPFSEDLCIAGISKIRPGVPEKPQYRTKAHWDMDDLFNLLFEFQSGRSIEVDAETVELVVLQHRAD